MISVHGKGLFLFYMTTDILKCIENTHTDIEISCVYTYVKNTEHAVQYNNGQKTPKTELPRPPKFASKVQRQILKIESTCHIII